MGPRQQRDEIAGDRRDGDARGGASGKASISAVNRAVAVAFDMRERLAASCQGSTSSRANMESTLSSMPFL